MKKRVRKIANFFAFNLLFFSLYLNFIHKDKSANMVIPQNSAFSGTVLPDNTGMIVDKKNEVTVNSAPETTPETTPEKITENSTEALKLSIN